MHLAPKKGGDMLPVVCAILMEEEKILVVQRGPGRDRAGDWEFPGGKVEAGESEEQALIREIKEELGLTIQPVQRLGAVMHYYADLAIELIYYRCRRGFGELQLHEHQAYRWCTISELREMPLSEADRKVLEQSQHALQPEPPVGWKRVVVKIGTNVLTQEDGQLDLSHIDHLVDQIAGLKQQGLEVILVSSGAVAAGKAMLPQATQLNPVLRRQILSALGQTRLMNYYQAAFARHGFHVAQVLATKEDFRDRQHYLNMQSCLQGLLRGEIVPVLNENDVVSITELMFTDNDELAGLVAAMTNAGALLILSSVDGVLTGPPGEPGSEVIPEIDPGDSRFLQYILPSRSSFGRGGMNTKFRVARKAAALGITTVVANGKRQDILPGILAGTISCTFFRPERGKSNRKKWLAHLQEAPKARVFINEGAARALRSRERVGSLLPVGVERLEGSFERGDLLSIWHADEEIGIGLAQYGDQTAAQYLGQKGKRPLVHYDYLVLYV